MMKTMMSYDGGRSVKEGSNIASKEKSCGKMMVVRKAGHGGKFWGCLGFPTCRSSRSIMITEQTVNTNAEIGNYVAAAMANR